MTFLALNECVFTSPTRKTDVGEKVYIQQAKRAQYKLDACFRQENFLGTKFYLHILLFYFLISLLFFDFDFVLALPIHEPFHVFIVRFVR